MSPFSASAQELEPGAYWPIPTGLNIVTVVNSFNFGDVAFDPSAPIDEASARINTTAFLFTRAFSLAGRSANAGVVVPVVGGHVEGLYLGEFAEVDRFGLGDPRLRFAVNLYGAPAMTPQGVRVVPGKTIVGVSFSVRRRLANTIRPSSSTSAPTAGRSSRRSAFARGRGKWVVEAMAGVWLFTDNTEFIGGRTREQDPIFAIQFHLTYRFKRTMWLAGDANYFTGGRTTIGGKQNLDLQRNSRIGATFSQAFRRRPGDTRVGQPGAYTTIGADFTSIAVGYNYAWVR